MVAQKIISQKGFTLVELMIALALGLIVIAAAVGIYIANYRTLAVQKSSSEMQSASMFGIQPLENRLRLANLGNAATSINDTTTDGGVVLATANAPSVTDSTKLSNTASGDSNTNNKSDQLTIQFTNMTPFAMYDCEGNEVPANRKSIERYFVRQGTNGLVLACDSGVFDASGKLSSFGDDGVVLISDVDVFRYRLGVQNIDSSGSVNTQFYTAKEYLALGTKPPIISIKSGVIARGSTPVSTGDGLSEFKLLGENETLNSGVSKKVVRNTFETTTLLRNARVVTIKVNKNPIN